jgi:hypothetical protein
MNTSKWSGGEPKKQLFDPDLARMKRWIREQRWIHGWNSTNARRPAHISPWLPVDLVETHRLNPDQDIATMDTCSVRIVHTEQMSPVTTVHKLPITDAIPKTTKALPRIIDQVEYQMCGKSLLANLQYAVEQFWTVADTTRMPSKMFLSRFNLHIAQTMNYVQEAEVNGHSQLFFVYADVFLIQVEARILLSDQVILCQQ